MDNVRLGRQSLTKKISFQQKQPKQYRTIEPQLDKEPTRKKITIQDYHISTFLNNKKKIVALFYILIPNPKGKSGVRASGKGKKCQKIKEDLM